MEQKPHQPFTDLDVWKKAREFKKELESLAKTFPLDEKRRLSDQLIRSARSINANIAEGHGRFTYKDQLHFCVQARGSLSETLNHLIDAFDAKYITQDQLSFHKQKYDEIERLLNGYITYLRGKL
ncbi:four helix bundle protein [Flavisolibacter ginsenosidimutans]|uniref:Four helix bundle protein n=1 Tax=Flavisolibacter ginsenosidimutans TaxID=661481 RepID=A0A5B8ULY1_9BACT|nr:four helix bundle protein [Flavisolibacter ginsenosidimutans]QEC57684.1 four helix bundle protein [Flavisolibacter ginsenosidimutans]